jgi:hypothetical protein
VLDAMSDDVSPAGHLALSDEELRLVGKLTVLWSLAEFLMFMGTKFMIPSSRPYSKVVRPETIKREFIAAAERVLRGNNLQVAHECAHEFLALTNDRNAFVHGLVMTNVDNDQTNFIRLAAKTNRPPAELPAIVRRLSVLTDKLAHLICHIRSPGTAPLWQGTL